MPCERSALAQDSAVIEGFCTVRLETANSPIHQLTNSDVDDLPRVHAVVGIERTFEVAHHADAGAMFGLEERHLARADPVLSGGRAAHRQRTRDESFVERARLGQLGLAGRIQDIEKMEIAVAGVADEADRE